MTAAPGAESRSLKRAAALLAGVVLAADQASKWWILNAVAPPPGGIEITPFFNIVLVWNRGVTFGLFNMGGETTRWLLVAMTAAIVAVLIAWLARTTRRLPGLALGGIIGGALGNLIDRLIHGQVVDFLDFHALGWHWPAFNVADAAIVCGVAALFLDTFVAPREPLG